MKKTNSVWVGLVVYLVVVLAPPVLKVAGVAPLAALGWALATCLLWGPPLLLAAIVLATMVFELATAPRA